MDDNREQYLLYKLIYQVLLEIREEAHEKKNSKIFLLADLVHNIPTKLSTASQASDFKAIYAELQERAAKRGISQWLENAVKQM